MADHAELSSIASSLGELCQRVTALVDRSASDAVDDPQASELVALERALLATQRRLERLVTASLG